MIFFLWRESQQALRLHGCLQACDMRNSHWLRNMQYATVLAFSPKSWKMKVAAPQSSVNITDPGRHGEWLGRFFSERGPFFF